jgi:hypothetical protein
MIAVFPTLFPIPRCTVSELAICGMPWIIRLPEEQQNQILLLAYRYAEERIKRMLT